MARDIKGAVAVAGPIPLFPPIRRWLVAVFVGEIGVFVDKRILLALIFKSDFDVQFSHSSPS